nr:MAG TPA: hypothetical protein [Caudoviricetes sp.]
MFGYEKIKFYLCGIRKDYIESYKDLGKFTFRTIAFKLVWKISDITYSNRRNN